MANFARIENQRINLDRVNHYCGEYNGHISKYFLCISFGKNDDVYFTTEDKQEYEGWLRLLGE